MTSAEVALVAGGAGGIGAAAATALGDAGWAVVIGDRDERAARRLAAQLGPSATAIALDVTDIESWETAVAVAGRCGRLRAMVNAAGVLAPGGLLDVDPADFDTAIETNLRGCFLGLRVTGAAMTREGGGSIVALGSAVAHGGTPGLAGYGASKWAIRGLMRTAAIELGPAGIRVNAVLPGSIATDLSADPDPRRASWFADLPAGRQGRTEDVVAAIMYLLSDASAFTTGSELVVDGGMTASGNLPPRS